MIDRQQRAVKYQDRIKLMNSPANNQKSSSFKFTQHLKVDNFKHFIEIMSDLKINKVTDTRIHLLSGMKICFLNRL